MSAGRPIDLIRARLEATDCAVRGRMAQCPAHDDREPSLSIDEGDDGRVLLHCFAGCEIDRILEALDLGYHHLFPEHTWPDHLKSPSSLSTSTKGSLPPSRQNPRPGPSPRTGNTTEEDGPEIFGLLREHAAGVLPPVPVAVREIPASALPKNMTASAAQEVATVARRVAEDMAFLVGLRLTVAEDRPLPYATAFCADRVPGVRNKAHAGRLLRLLERAGVIRRVDAMPPRRGGPPRGTLLYEIVPLAAAAPVEVALPDAVEASEPVELIDERVGLELAVERRDELAVEGAEVTEPGVPPRRAVGMVASGYRAGRPVHVADGNSADGDGGGHR